MVDIRERTAFEPLAQPAGGIRYTFNVAGIAPVSSADHPVGCVVVGGGVHMGATLQMAGFVVEVSSGAQNAHGAEPAPVARRRTPDEIFEEVDERYPNIMACLAE